MSETYGDPLTVLLDGQEVGSVRSVMFRDYRHSQTRTLLQLAERKGWEDSVSRDVHDRRYDAVATVIVRAGGVDPYQGRTVARSSRVRLTRQAGPS